MNTDVFGLFVSLSCNGAVTQTLIFYISLWQNNKMILNQTISGRLCRDPQLCPDAPAVSVIAIHLFSNAKMMIYVSND